MQDLENIFQMATDEMLKDSDGEFSDKIKWFEAHQKGRELWHELASAALCDIDKDSKGNSELFKFLEEATKFEDILYGLEKYYRDHTLHSLWVYLIGEYILREQLPELYINLNWYLFNDIEKDKFKYKYDPELVEYAEKKEKKLCSDINEKKDSIWCLIALCHDLGYSLSKLTNLNDRVKKVLEFLDIPNLNQVGYSMELEHQYLLSQFLESMAMDVSIVPSENYKEVFVKELTKEDKIMLDEIVLIKCFRDDSTYWRLCKSLENKRHGILSSYLIYKILGIFADTWIFGSSEEWGLEDTQAVDNIIRGDILFAIAQHNFDFAHLSQLSSLADILVLADEVEEFSRLTRPMLSRKYHDTMAEAEIVFKKTKRGKYIGIEIIYEVSNHQDICDFFNRKAEQLCKFYSLGLKEQEEKEKIKKYAIKSIKMTAKQAKKLLYFDIVKGKNKKGYLPNKKRKWNDMKEYTLKCVDDTIYVGNTDEKLEDWFNLEQTQ